MLSDPSRAHRSRDSSSTEGLLGPLFEFIDGLTRPVLTAVAPITAPILGVVHDVTAPVLAAVAPITAPVLGLTSGITGPILADVDCITNPLTGKTCGGGAGGVLSGILNPAGGQALTAHEDPYSPWQ